MTSNSTATLPSRARPARPRSAHTAPARRAATRPRQRPTYDAFHKTRVAAGYLLIHANNETTHQPLRRLFNALHDCDAALAAADDTVADAIRQVVRATAEVIGINWLDSNASDPDIARINRLLNAGGGQATDAGSADTRHEHYTGDDIAALDDLLSRILWVRFDRIFP